MARCALSRSAKRPLMRSATACASRTAALPSARSRQATCSSRSGAVPLRRRGAPPTVRSRSPACGFSLSYLSRCAAFRACARASRVSLCVARSFRIWPWWLRCSGSKRRTQQACRATPRLVFTAHFAARVLDGSSYVSSRPIVPEEPGLRIAQVAPLYESVPPKLYGGTERVVSYLTEELGRQGHEVTLFASGDSITRARLVAACDRSLRLDQRCVDQMSHHFLLLEQVFQRAHEFDVIHFHVDYLHFPLSRRQPYAQLTTLHGRLDLPDLVPL